MEQEQPLSRARILVWSIMVVSGVLGLAWFTPPEPVKTADTTLIQQDWIGLFSLPVDIASIQHSAQTNIQINFSSNAHPRHPGFACSDPYQHSSLIARLTSSQKPLVISSGQ